MVEIQRWLAGRPTPLLWVSGPVGCGKTTGVEAGMRGAAAHVAMLRLSAFGLDDAYAKAGMEDEGGRLTAKRLLRLATNQGIVVLDGLDALQQATGQDAGDVTDCRLRQFLFAVCHHALPGAAVVVTSRMAPPGWLPANSITVINLPEIREGRPPSLPGAGSIERRVLELASLSRRAIDSTAIHRMSGIEERVSRRVLSSAAEAGLVMRVSRESYQVPDWIRPFVLSDTTRAEAVRKAAIEALREEGSDPERLLDLLVDDGNIDGAVEVYWHSLGNFSQLHREGRDPFGAQLCRRLNGGLGPDEVSPGLGASEGAWAVMNDWSQFASCCGDVRTSGLAAASAYRVLPKDHPRWDAATLAGHVGKAYLLGGDLPAAMTWCERSWGHAREGMRKTEGFAVGEVMDAYDWSANTIAKIYLRLERPLEIRRLIDDLAALHTYARQSIQEFNASAIFPLEGPAGEVTAEQMADGRLAAMLALAEGRFAELEPLAAAGQGALVLKELYTLLLRARISERRDEEAGSLLQTLRESAERLDDCAAECELAVLAQGRPESPSERLALAEAYLPRAEACGLGLDWRDLQLARSRALEELERLDEARAAAEAALFGAAGMAGAYPDQDWVAVREGVRLLQSVGGNVPDQVLADLERSAPPERLSPRKPVARRTAPASEGGVAGREKIHAAAVRALEAYESDGTPFVLYFRKFGLEVLHGPFELGPKLTENALRDVLPPEVEVVTVQEHASMAYDFGSSRFRREAPALLLEDERWVEAVKALIPLADLIVSEPLMLSEGVRQELQMIYEMNRWDRAVLVLPPQHGFLELIDNDSLIQMFPRCVWADSLHTELFTDSPVVADLLERVRGIVSLPAERRRTLRDLSARDKAYPVDLLPVAEHLETEARLASVFNQAEETTRYYAFWQMFRAVAIRGARYLQGDLSASNRCKLAHSYLEMSKIMLDHSVEGDRIVLQGDPAEAKLLVQSAFGLLQELEDDWLVQFLRAESEEQWEQLSKLEQAVRNNEQRFELRLRYGPLVKRGMEDAG